jgi:general secretion pathway protein N
MTPGRRLFIAQAVVAGGLSLLSGVEMLGWGKGYRLLPDAPAASAAGNLPDIKSEAYALAAYPERYKLIEDKPVFNEDRKPTPPDGPKPTEGGGPAQPLAVVLTGVILSGDLQMALLKDNANQKPMRIRLGTPLEGSQSAWKLVELKPRAAIFEAGGQRQELALATYDKALTPPPPSAFPAPPPPPQQQAQANANGQPPPPPPPIAGGQPPAAPVAPPDPFYGNTAPVANQSNAPTQQGAPNADEIRRRIEERRRQLREEAQRMSEQQN